MATEDEKLQEVKLCSEMLKGCPTLRPRGETHSLRLAAESAWLPPSHTAHSHSHSFTATRCVFTYIQPRIAASFLTRLLPPPLLRRGLATETNVSARPSLLPPPPRPPESSVAHQKSMDNSPATSTNSSTHSSPLLAPTNDSSTAPSTPGVDSMEQPPPLQASAKATAAEGTPPSQDREESTTPTAASPTVNSPASSADDSTTAAAAVRPPPIQTLPTAPNLSLPSPTSPPPAAAAAASPSQTPPLLFPRATAPAGLPQRKPPAPGGGLRAGVRGAPLGAGGMKIPPSLAAKMAAVSPLALDGPRRGLYHDKLETTCLHMLTLLFPNLLLVGLTPPFQPHPPPRTINR